MRFSLAEVLGFYVADSVRLYNQERESRGGLRMLRMALA